jgi:hypothetical protein
MGKERKSFPLSSLVYLVLSFTKLRPSEANLTGGRRGRGRHIKNLQWAGF